MAWKVWRVHATGDHAGGWIVDVHDGVNQATYWPEAHEKADAERLARDEHIQRFWPNLKPEEVAMAEEGAEILAVAPNPPVEAT